MSALTGNGLKHIQGRGSDVTKYNSDGDKNACKRDFMIGTRHEKNFANLYELRVINTEKHEIILRDNTWFCYTEKMKYLCPHLERCPSG